MKKQLLLVFVCLSFLVTTGGCIGPGGRVYRGGGQYYANTPQGYYATTPGIALQTAAGLIYAPPGTVGYYSFRDSGRRGTQNGLPVAWITGYWLGADGRSHTAVHKIVNGVEASSVLR